MILLHVFCLSSHVHVGPVSFLDNSLFTCVAVLGLQCCLLAFSSCGRPGPFSRGGAQASHCGGLSAAEHRLSALRLSSCGTRASLPLGTWDLPGVEIKPASPALAGGIVTTGPPGQAPCSFSFFPFLLYGIVTTGPPGQAPALFLSFLFSLYHFAVSAPVLFPSSIV